MSEMSAEKKKEIEKYIVKSYFGGGKNVESLANGADVIKGTDDGCIPQLIVEVTYFGESGIVMIKWNIYGDSQQNSFSMHICRELEIERNRCDSVDSMMYAWEAWKSKIQGNPVFLKTNDEDLQKDKRIEELEREIKALRAEKEVMERHIQELESHNVSLAETNNDKKRIEFKMRSMMVAHKPYQDHSDIEITGIIPDREIFAANNPFDIPCDVVMVSKKDFEALQTENEELKKKLGEFDFMGWMESAKLWKKRYDDIFKLIGFSSVEEIHDYLTNGVKCDTLHEAISKLHNDVFVQSRTANSYREQIKEWKEATGFKTPEEAKDYWAAKLSESGETNELLAREIRSWRKATSCSTPEEASKVISAWQDATGCKLPSMAKETLDYYKRRLGNAVQAANCAVRHLDNITF